MKNKALLKAICLSGAGVIFFVCVALFGIMNASKNISGRADDTTAGIDESEITTDTPSSETTEPDEQTEPVEAHSHVWNTSYIKAASCEERGYTVYTCSCGQENRVYTDEPTGHVFTLEKTVEPSCANMGYSYFSCACGYGYKGDFTTGGDHVFGIKTEVPVTCTTAGYTEYVCVCGYSFIGDKEEPTGHNYVMIKVVEPTCAKQGYTLYECSCGLQEKRDYTDALAHEYEVSKVIEATCLTQGKTLYKCKNCGNTYYGNYTAKGDHTYPIARKVIATATQDGYTMHICLCGATYTDSVVKATGTKSAAPYTTQNTIKIANANVGFVYDVYGETVSAKGDMEADLYPASITKLVTALVAYEYASDSLMITAGDELSHVTSTASRAGFYKGYKANLGQLMAGLLLPSGCDAGYIIAQGVGRVIDPKATTDEAAWRVFVCEMNNWSRQHGLVNSYWENPDGNHATNHHTCMRDLILVAMECYKNENVLKYTKLKSYSCKIASGRSFTWTNTNGMLSKADDCIGLKTGYTGYALNCLLTLYEYDGKVMVIGVFGCPSSAYRTSVSKTLYDIFHDKMTAK